MGVRDAFVKTATDDYRPGSDAFRKDGPDEVRQSFVRAALAMADSIERWHRNCSESVLNPDELAMLGAVTAFRAEMGRVV